MSIDKPTQHDQQSPPSASGARGPSAPANRPLLDLTLVVASVLLLALAFFIWMRGASQPARQGGLEPGQRAPEIVAAGWVNGEMPADEQLAGKVLVVHGWFTTCPNCVQEAPRLVQTYEKYRDRGVVFIGMTFETEERLPQIERYLERTGITWPNAYGAEQTIRAFESDYSPATWVIGPDGVIVWNHDSPGELADGIEQALARK